MFGIDVSKYQGKIDWETVKKQIDFAILSLGWIGNKNNHTVDPQFERNYTECKRLGIPLGVYVYNYCNNEENVKAGANWVIKNLKGRELELPVYIDMEDETIKNYGRDKLTNICIEFNTIIEKSGYWAGVYANKDWFDNYLNKNQIKNKYTTWIATYNNAVDLYKGEYDMWQNTSKAKINGISGNVDTNYMYRDLIGEIRNIDNTQEGKSTINLAYEVIDGKYGNGEERVKALGSLYDEVQAKVNEILNNQKENTYVVKKGDTLSSIAKKYNVTYQDIAKKNNISNPNKIYAGQILKI